MQEKYFIPKAFRQGGFGLDSLSGADGDMLELEFDGAIIECSIPGLYTCMRACVYDVPGDVFENTLNACYGESGSLKSVTVKDGGGIERLVYISYASPEEAEREIRSFALENAALISKQLIGSKEKAARLFTEFFYDGECFDYHALIGTEAQKKAVEERYPDDPSSAADNSGNYIIYSKGYTNMIKGNNQRLGAMVIFAGEEGSYASLAAEIMTEYIRENVPDKLDRTEDFQFIASEYD